MNVIPTALPGVVVVEPEVFRDDRGYFLEPWSLVAPALRDLASRRALRRRHAPVPYMRAAAE